MVEPADPPRILIAGAYGTFGRLLTRELLTTTEAHLVLAGRSLERAIALCRALDAGRRATPLALDLSDRQQFAQAVPGCFAVTCAAGPFQTLDPTLPRIAADAGAHWLDISDDPAWLNILLHDEALAATTQRAGLSVVLGQSCLPALSAALARWCLACTANPVRARVTLVVDNRNPKGMGAVSSVLAAGLDDPTSVELPSGRRTAYRLGSDSGLNCLHALSVPLDLRVAFEWAPIGRTLALAGRLMRPLPPANLTRLTRVITSLAAPLSRFGSSGGLLQAEAWDTHGRRTYAALLDDSQRLAILPCALAVNALLDGTFTRRGVIRPWDWLTPDEWIARLGARGVWLTHNLPRS